MGMHVSCNEFYSCCCARRSDQLRVCFSNAASGEFRVKGIFRVRQHRRCVIVPGVSHINKYDWLVQNMTWLATWSRLGKAKWLTATCREYDWRRPLCVVKTRLQYYVHAINCNKSSRNVRLCYWHYKQSSYTVTYAMYYRLSLRVAGSNYYSYSTLEARNYTKC
jgi:hypothetical protein